MKIMLKLPKEVLKQIIYLFKYNFFIIIVNRNYLINLVHLNTMNKTKRDFSSINTNQKMDLFIRVNGKMVFDLEKVTKTIYLYQQEHIFGKMEVCMKAGGKIIYQMVKVEWYMQMGITILGSGQMINNMEMDYTILMMELNIRVVG